MTWCVQLPPGCLISMQASFSAHHWARKLVGSGPGCAHHSGPPGGPLGRRKERRQRCAQFGDWLGLTPQQNSSGGKNHLGSITKRGDMDVRMLLIQRAKSAVMPPDFKDLSTQAENTMVSAVFHSPWGSSARESTSANFMLSSPKLENAIKLISNNVEGTLVRRQFEAENAVKPARQPFDWRGLLLAVLPPGLLPQLKAGIFQRRLFRLR